MRFIASLLLEVFRTVQALVVFCGFVFALLYFNNADLLDEMLVLMGKGPKKKNVQRKSPELPAELKVDGTLQVLGDPVIDPLTPLEDLTSAGTKNFLAEQQKVTDEYVDNVLARNMRSFHSQYKGAINYEHLECPVCFGQTYFFFKRIRPELLQYSLFSTTDLTQDAALVFDPNTVRFAHAGSDSTDITDGMPIINATWISEDGYRMAYGYTDAINSKVMSIRVRDLRQRKDLSVDLLRNCYVDYTSVAWIDSRTGFFYTTQVLITEHDEAGSIAAMSIANRLLFHRIGTTQDQDLVIFETIVDHDNLVLQPRVTSDSHYLILEIFKRKREVSCQSGWRNTVSEHSSISHCGNKVYYYDLTKFDGSSAESMGSCIKLIDTFSYRFDYISNIEEDFWFRTNYKAPNFRVIRLTLPLITEDMEENIPADQITFMLLNAWKQCLDWIPQRLDGDFLESAGIAAHTVLVLKYLRNNSHEVLLYDLTQHLAHESQVPVADLPHPPYGSILGPHCNFYSSEIFYQFTDFSEPAAIFRVLIDRDPYSGTIEISFNEVHSTQLPTIDKQLFTTTQELCETKRNVYVPLLISGLREVIEEEVDQPKPCIVCINGGFGVSYTPRLSLPFLLFAQQSRGIVVVANVQGAGIYGSTYANHGKQDEKEFAVQDLAYILRYLVKRKYTTHAQIALFGGTFNGTLIGSALVQYPSLFQAAVVVDGIFDLIKYHIWNPPDRSADALFASQQGEDGDDTPNLRARRSIDSIDWKASTWYSEFGGCFAAGASADRG